ncbi:serine O-acetyltransferase [Sphingobacterium siyangense]|uniref:serine O-acetyltransferase n=1 Tax=Sphingobacterium siyangense TaxID=459529 RepID=UPI003DA5BB43
MTVDIGSGVFFPHYGFVVINGGCRIGTNCNILQGVTLGNTKGGKNPGNPTIGNEVYIGPSATVVGGVIIGDRVLIAPNAYVNFDVPNDSIVLGNPAKIIPRENPTKNYLNNLYRHDTK